MSTYDTAATTSAYDIARERCRRCETNLYMSLLIDVGLCYCRSLGQQEGTAFLSAQNIPDDIVRRVVHTALRRGACAGETQAAPTR
jgi:hypothetical protein